MLRKRDRKGLREEMRIAICDDSRTDANKIGFALMDVSPNLVIEYFENGYDLLSAAEEEPMIDLAFLDIYLKEENGMEIARKLRECSPRTELVFCTSSRDFAVDAFRIRAVDYLLKPYTELDIVRAFARAHVEEREGRGSQVLLKCGNEFLVFSPENVVKIESERHYTRIVSRDGSVQRIHMSFTEVAEKFNEGFLNVKRGLSVRMDHIIRIKGDTIYISDGSHVTMSRAKKDELVAEYTKYMSLKV